MNYINVGTENSSNIDLYYEDHGSGKPIILIHGWPLSSASWEKQVPALLDAGYRVISYDRRGFGNSSKPTIGYDYDTLTADLHKLVTALDLRDVILAGFSMGGGEVARYFGRYGSDRVSGAVFISAIPPYLLKTQNNPEGVDQKIFDGVMKALGIDRPAFLTTFFSDFYNFDLFKGKLVSEEFVRTCWNIAVSASPTGTAECVRSWLTDFRDDLKKIDVPTLIIHGDADRIVPLPVSGKRTHEAVKKSRLVEVEGGPHGLIWNHAEKVNTELVSFLWKEVGKAVKTVSV